MEIPSQVTARKKASGKLLMGFRRVYTRARWEQVVFGMDYKLDEWN